MLPYERNVAKSKGTYLLALILALCLLDLPLGKANQAIAQEEQATDFESYGYRASYEPLSIGWVEGNLGDSWEEGEWVPYQLVISNVQTDYPNLTGFPDIQMSYDFTHHGTRFVDLVRGTQVGTAMLTNAQGWPMDSGSPYPMTSEPEVEAAQNDIGNTAPLENVWSGFTLLDLPDEQINRDQAGTVGTPTDEVHTFRITVADLLAAGLSPTANTIVIYYQLHESRSFIWQNSLQKYYSDDYTPGTETDGWGGYLYALSSPDYAGDTRFGSGYVPGSSGHITVEFGGYAKTVPIPIPERLPGTVSGLKWRDDNGNGMMDGGEITLSGWEIHVSGTVESIFFQTSTHTDEFGNYSFPNLTVGTWTIKEDEQRDVPVETGYCLTYPSEGDTIGQGISVFVGPPPVDISDVGWDVRLTLDVPDQGGMSFANRLCDLMCEASSDTVCVGQTVTLTGNCTGGIPLHSYCWQKEPYTGSCLSDSTDLVIMNAQLSDGGTYRLIVDDVHDCADTCYADLIVSDCSPPELVDDLTSFFISDSGKDGTGDICLQWSEPYDDVGVACYVVYRSTAPTSLGDSLASTADTMYIDAGAAGDVNTNHFYVVKAKDAAGNKSEESNKVGEFDIGLINGE